MEKKTSTYKLFFLVQDQLADFILSRCQLFFIVGELPYHEPETQKIKAPFKCQAKQEEFYSLKCTLGPFMSDNTS